MTPRARRITALSLGTVAAVALVDLDRAGAFCTLTSRWEDGQVVMAFNFPPSGTLINGTASWAQNVESAMQEWSAVSSDFRFISAGPGSAGQNNFDNVNNMLFAAQAQGSSFEDDVLALTLTRTDLSGNAIESDIVFNSEVIWNAYDGTIRVDAAGNVVFDFRRVALHELGHVLGLDHPDEACDQTVEAVMNSQTADVDRLTEDDRNGLAAIYAGDNVPPIADAGPDQFGDGTEPFVLNAGGSRDPDGFIVSYDWRRDGALVARGRVAEISLRRGSFAIQLTVTDDRGASSVDTLVITVGSEFIPPQPGNVRPVADAGADRTIRPGHIITLDGSRSFDPDGSLERFVWSRGNIVLGRDPVIQVALSGGVHLITLTVFDNVGDAASDSVVITVGSQQTEGPDPDPDPAPDDPATTTPPTPPPLCGMLGLLAAMSVPLIGTLRKLRTP